MNDLLHNIALAVKLSTVWPAVIGALLAVAIEFRRHTWATALLAICSGALVAYAATEPVIEFFNLSQNAGHAVAGVLGISGRNLIVWLLLVSKDPLKAWKSTKDDE